MTADPTAERRLAFPAADEQTPARAPSARMDHAPFVRMLFESSVDGVLATDSCGHRLYTNPALDSLIGMDGRLPLFDPQPPPYVPWDHRQAYLRLAGSVPGVLAGGGPVAGRLDLLDGAGDRLAVDVTIGALTPPQGGTLAIWLLRVNGRSGQRSLLPAGWDRAGWRESRNGETRTLTRREAEVLEMLVDGWRVQSIAAGLFVSESTVRNHLKSIFKKLGVHSQRELIERARGWSGIEPV